MSNSPLSSLSKELLSNEKNGSKSINIVSISQKSSLQNAKSARNVGQAKFNECVQMITS
jgi:hypothetical protein